jgi:hypothetical protein
MNSEPKSSKRGEADKKGRRRLLLLLQKPENGDKKQIV